MSDKLKVEISVKKTVMRKTKTKDGKPREYLYWKVENRKRIEEIEFNSENWVVYKESLESSYILLGQRNASNKSTGFYKVIENSKAKVVEKLFGSLEVYAKNSNDDWIYYERKSKS